MEIYFSLFSCIPLEVPQTLAVVDRASDDIGPNARFHPHCAGAAPLSASRYSLTSMILWSELQRAAMPAVCLQKREKGGVGAFLPQARSSLFARPLFAPSLPLPLYAKMHARTLTYTLVASLAAMAFALPHPDGEDISVSSPCSPPFLFSAHQLLPQFIEAKKTNDDTFSDTSFNVAPLLPFLPASPN